MFNCAMSKIYFDWQICHSNNSTVVHPNGGKSRSKPCAALRIDTLQYASVPLSVWCVAITLFSLMTKWRRQATTNMLWNNAENTSGDLKNWLLVVLVHCINEHSRHDRANIIGNTHGPTHLMELVTLARALWQLMHSCRQISGHVYELARWNEQCFLQASNLPKPRKQPPYNVIALYGYCAEEHGCGVYKAQ